MDYKKKYLKYKLNYINLKKKGGSLLYPLYWEKEVPIEFINIDNNCEKSK